MATTIREERRKEVYSGEERRRDREKKQERRREREREKRKVEEGRKERKREKKRGLLPSVACVKLYKSPCLSVRVSKIFLESFWEPKPMVQ